MSFHGFLCWLVQQEQVIESIAIIQMELIVESFTLGLKVYAYTKQTLCIALRLNGQMYDNHLQTVVIPTRMYLFIINLQLSV